MRDYEQRAIQAKGIMAGYPDDLRKQLMNLFHTTHYDALTICNIHARIKSVQSTKEILDAASRTGTDPIQILNVIGR